MKKRWLGITLTILVGIILIAAVGIVAFKLGMIRGSRFASTEGVKTMIVEKVKGKLPEGAVFEKIPGKSEYFEGMMGDKGMIYGLPGKTGSLVFQKSAPGLYPMQRFDNYFRLFSPIKCLGSLVLLALLVLLIIFIVKALKNDRRVIVKVLEKSTESEPPEDEELQEK